MYQKKSALSTKIPWPITDIAPLCSTPSCSTASKSCPGSRCLPWASSRAAELCWEKNPKQLTIMRTGPTFNSWTQTSHRPQLCAATLPWCLQSLTPHGGYFSSQPSSHPPLPHSQLMTLLLISLGKLKDPLKIFPLPNLSSYQCMCQALCRPSP